ncbi:MAG: type III pantothenate kinase [Proteobacteria bacterium]|nr:type III pantothenate kinase [Pseudomonadota bacterium]MBU1715592.1 type III pantothenate kinase [Pseudomonadota bacterium]
MLLAIDVGNTHTVIGLFKKKELFHHWRVKTDPANTADELASQFYSLFAMEKINFSQIKGVIIASVVPPMQYAWTNFSQKHLSLQPLQVDSTIRTGMKILIDTPSELGADRIVNSVAAYARYHTALVVVDFGTAITFDCVSATGDYLGGAIAPGLSISLEALGKRTAKLPRVDISSPPDNPIGTNTVAAIKSGVLFGYGGMVEGLIARIKEQFQPETPTVIATGGMAAIIAPYAPSIEAVSPMLTLEGLRILYEKNL